MSVGSWQQLCFNQGLSRNGDSQYCEIECVKRCGSDAQNVPDYSPNKTLLTAVSAEYPSHERLRQPNAVIFCGYLVFAACGKQAGCYLKTLYSLVTWIGGETSTGVM